MLTETLIRQVVAGSDKQRFAISDNGTHIRANQGHSIPIDMSTHESVPPEVLYHGTAKNSLSAILHQGIKHGNRIFVHLSSDEETAHSVGQRHGLPVVLVVLARDMHRDDFRFFMSKNGVWLTEYVPRGYFNKRGG